MNSLASTRRRRQRLILADLLVGFLLTLVAH